MPTITVNDMDMFYMEYGRGTPLVYLHGGLLSSRAVVPSAKTLAEHCHVITPDSRAHGQSDNLQPHITYALMADDIAALIAALQLDRPFVAGWSDGGQVALELGMRYSDRIRGIVVGAAWFKFSTAVAEGSAALGFADGLVDLGRLHATAGDALDFFADMHPGGIDQLNAVASSLAVQWTTDLDYQPDDFAKIAVPTMIVHADRDGLIPIAQPVAMFEMIVDSELAIVPAATHNYGMAGQEDFARLIQGFMARHQG